ncbi:hypothetical protein DCD74_08455 [Lysobacter oculi]|uniref:Methyltransferase type 11 domain-containing protein n=1 Tax=Solilutibacter oculi TaxID=2698682 RepID=A0A344J6Q5_9GAMM|nr:class I SAM-dependent methyltransferase [Lysobacter oculi]AXA84715.1 hypothetical protein DCD74_08455 [Lysobacter oculi]
MDIIEKLGWLETIVRCPACNGQLTTSLATRVAGRLFSCVLHCANCRTDCGQVANFKYFFNGFPPGYEFKRALGVLSGRECIKVHSLGVEDAFQLTGNWQHDAEAKTVGAIGPNACIATLDVPPDAIGVGLQFVKHPWSGEAEIRLDDRLLATLDLHEEAGSMRLWYPVNTGSGGGRLEIRYTGKRNPKALADQVWLGSPDVVLATSGAPSVAMMPQNRGNPYPAEFGSLMARVRSDEWVLDCGSGDRAYPSPNVVNFEYSHFAAPDVSGDGHALPFADDAFDLVLSQAVVEHLYDPYAAVAEIHRCMSPGGTVFCESAFMQPLHAVPFHFFNTTPWGLERLFSAFDIQRIESVGDLGDTLAWIYAISGLREKGFGEQVDEIISSVRKLDVHIDPSALRMFSSFVTLLAKKKRRIADA